VNGGGRLIAPAELKSLSARSDAKGLARLALHLALLAASGTLVWLARGTWWLLLPALLLHGWFLVALFAPVHETVHMTAFASRRLNLVVGWLAALPGLSGKDGSHTAGNSPGVNDGAGALVVSSDEWAEREGKEILATIVAQAAVADEFAYLARTPANAAKLALEKAGLQPGDIDLWEINEAFASVTLNSIRMLGIDEERVNVNGGAVAIGHPIGASGARILATLVHELRRRGGGYGCAAICSGGGQGDAVIVQV